MIALRRRARLRFVDVGVTTLTGASGAVGDSPDENEEYHENEQIESDVEDAGHW